MQIPFPSSIFRPALLAAGCLLSVGSTVALADSSPDIQLPLTLANTENCVPNGDAGWGWDGQRSCFITKTWFYNASYPLSRTSSDINGDNLVWNRSDLLNKTVRCDEYNYDYSSSYNLSLIHI